MEGKVKWFNAQKGFGFIEAEDGDYFVHVSDLPEGLTLNEGEEVTFEPAQNERGKQAKNIQVH